MSTRPSMNGNVYSIPDGVKASPTVITSLSSTPDPDGTHRESVIVDGKVYAPLVANCPAASCTGEGAVAGGLGDPATQSYLNAVAQNTDKGLTIGGAVLSGFGAVIRGVNAMVGLADSSATVQNLAAVTNTSSLGVNAGLDTVAIAQARQVAMLQNNIGFNISPTAWDEYPTIGRNGTFVSDQQGVMSYFGNTAGKSEITISSSTAAQIESEMGLVPGSLQDGFKVRQITGLTDMQPVSTLEGNSYFLGPGNHLPGGAPEMVINSIPTVDNSLVKTILNVKVDK